MLKFSTTDISFSFSLWVTRADAALAGRTPAVRLREIVES